MKKVFGYIRVSTAKQGEGVSLIEQKDAISRYAEKYNLEIIRWFEEKETAAKQGRPLFTQMMRLLKGRKAQGVIIHKIDRSARNFRDWMLVDDLIHKGIEIHFAHENLDMNTRGGRLAADIQLAVAVDYIRNLSQEAKKGLYGRLKQGIYPFYAPVGYLNAGSGKAKTIDPVKGPLIKKAFELYATNKYSLHSLADHMYILGLRNVHEEKVNPNKLSHILNNTFYMGIIRVKGTIFNGIHEPLVSPRLFKQVQIILKGKMNQKVLVYDFKFRKMIRCNLCNTLLTGENQKGHTYYRCHKKDCPTKGIRETTVERFFLLKLYSIQFLPQEWEHLDAELKIVEQNWDAEQSAMLKIVNLQIGQLEQKLERLIDYFIEEGLDKDIFEKRKLNLLTELKEKQEQRINLSSKNSQTLQRILQFFELVKSLIKSYEMGIWEEKRNLMELVISNLSLSRKKLMISMRSPFFELANRLSIPSSGLALDTSRNSECIDLTDPLPEPSPPSVPLNREQMKQLLELIIERCKAGAFPELPSETEYEDDS